jgi:hypothetical protein
VSIVDAQQRGKWNAMDVDLVFSTTYKSFFAFGSWTDYRNDRLDSHFEMVVAEV